MFNNKPIKYVIISYWDWDRSTLGDHHLTYHLIFDLKIDIIIKL